MNLNYNPWKIKCSSSLPSLSVYLSVCLSIRLSVSLSLSFSTAHITARPKGVEWGGVWRWGWPVGWVGRGYVLLKQESVTSPPRVTLNATMFTSRKHFLAVTVQLADGRRFVVSENNGRCLYSLQVNYDHDISQPNFRLTFCRDLPFYVAMSDINNGVYAGIAWHKQYAAWQGEAPGQQTDEEKGKRAMIAKAAEKRCSQNRLTHNARLAYYSLNWPHTK